MLYDEEWLTARQPVLEIFQQRRPALTVNKRRNRARVSS
jgi:hypothetical protein